jgi:hypothetical protein
MMPPNMARRERLNLAQTLIFFSPSESRALGARGVHDLTQPLKLTTLDGPELLYVTPRRRVHTPLEGRKPSFAPEYNRTRAPLARAGRKRQKVKAASRNFKRQSELRRLSGSRPYAHNITGNHRAGRDEKKGERPVD